MHSYGNDRIAFATQEFDAQSGYANGGAIFSVDPAVGLQRLNAGPPYNAFDINERGQLAFGGGAIVVGDETGLREVVRIGDSAPDHGTFSRLESATINNRGEVVFRGETLSAPDPFYPDIGLFLATDVGIQTIVRTGELAPAGFGTFRWFHHVVQTDWGVVFTAMLTEPQSDDMSTGLYAWDGNQIHEIVRQGGELDGQTIGVHSLSYPDIAVNERGQVAYWARLENRHSLLALWTLPVPEPSCSALLIGYLLLALTWRFRHAPSQLNR